MRLSSAGQKYQYLATTDIPNGQIGSCILTETHTHGHTV